MKPIRIDNDGTLVFTTSLIDDYGLPELWGYEENYYVINDNESPLMMDYDLECEFKSKTRPIHRYNRTERFKHILAQLLGLKNTIIPFDVLKKITCTKWDGIRNILKKNGLKKYYNHIPEIIYIKTKKSPIDLKITNALWLKMVNDFLIFQDEFINKKITHRKYFPSLKFIAYKIMLQNNAKFNNIVFIKTEKKRLLLNEIWEKVME